MTRASSRHRRFRRPLCRSRARNAAVHRAFLAALLVLASLTPSAAFPFLDCEALPGWSDADVDESGIAGHYLAMAVLPAPPSLLYPAGPLAAFVTVANAKGPAPERAPTLSSRAPPRA